MFPWLLSERLLGTTLGGCEGGVRRAPVVLAGRNFSHARDEHSIPPDTRSTIRRWPRHRGLRARR